MPVPALGPAALIQGTALRLPFADETVDLVVTSPPFFGLRSYTDGGEHLAGQLGSEATPLEFLSALWAATAELKRVLKPGGSIFVNLGDKYAGGGMGGHGGPSSSFKGTGQYAGQLASGYRKTSPGVPAKSLLLLPEAYRLGCTGMLAQLGGPDPGLDLICRSVIVWSKRNPLPESVRDRVRRSHEDWVHLVKSPRYYSALDEIRRPYENDGRARGNRQGNTIAGNFPGRGPGALNMTGDANPLGKLPGSVWTVATEPLRLPLELGIDHYAAMPSEWPRRLILGFSPPGICLSCGEGRVPVTSKGEFRQAGHGGSYGATEYIPNGREQDVWHGTYSSSLRQVRDTSILGYACACTPYTDHPGKGTGASREQRRGAWVEGGGSGTPQADNSGGLWNNPKTGPWREYHLDGWTPPPTRPAVVLDVFGGTGTTAMTARALGRFGVSLDLSMDYCRAAAWRVWESPGVGKVRDRTWPPPPRPRRSRRSRQTAEGTQLTLLNPAG